MRWTVRRSDARDAPPVDWVVTPAVAIEVLAPSVDGDRACGAMHAGGHGSHNRSCGRIRRAQGGRDAPNETMVGLADGPSLANVEGQVHLAQAIESLTGVARARCPRCRRTFHEYRWLETRAGP